MVDLETILIALVLSPLFAAVGLTTVVAFGLMGILGLVSEWSFKRIFFTSFLLALAAPIMLGIATASAIADGSLQRELREGIAQVLPGSEEIGRNWQEIGPRVEEVRNELDAGEITSDEARDRIEQVINEQTGIEVNLDGVTIDGEANVIRIEND